MIQISIFPSKEFYDGSLENGSLVERQTKRQWHAYRCFGPFCFFDIDGTESQPSGSGSWVNEEEVDFIILLYHKLVNQYTELRSSSQLAIISPYRYQVKLLRDRIRENFGERSDHLVDINTVDGFQVLQFQSCKPLFVLFYSKLLLYREGKKMLPFFLACEQTRAKVLVSYLISGE